jgi:hypothetical protein
MQQGKQTLYKFVCSQKIFKYFETQPELKQREPQMKTWGIATLNSERACLVHLLFLLT